MKYKSEMPFEVGAVFVIYIASTLVSFASAQNLSFVWQASVWSECKYRALPTKYILDSHVGLKTSHCCQCYHVRNIPCKFLSDSGQDVPPFFCLRAGLSIPVAQEPCWPCQNNYWVLSQWSNWTECTRTCNPAFRQRTRQILMQLSPGGKNCAHLVETSNCRDSETCLESIYEWRNSSWTSCRKVSAITLCKSLKIHKTSVKIIQKNYVKNSLNN